MDSHVDLRPLDALRGIRSHALPVADESDAPPPSGDVSAAPISDTLTKLSTLTEVIRTLAAVPQRFGLHEPSSPQRHRKVRKQQLWGLMSVG